MDSSSIKHKDILSFSLESEEWTKEGDMLEGRSAQGISVVDTNDYKKWCNVPTTAGPTTAAPTKAPPAGPTTIMTIVKP